MPNVKGAGLVVLVIVMVATTLYSAGYSSARSSGILGRHVDAGSDYSKPLNVRWYTRIYARESGPGGAYLGLVFGPLARCEEWLTDHFDSIAAKEKERTLQRMISALQAYSEKGQQAVPPASPGRR